MTTTDYKEALPREVMTVEGTITFNKFFDTDKMKAVLEKYSPRVGSNWLNQMHIVGACLGDGNARMKSWVLTVNQSDGDRAPVDIHLAHDFMVDLSQAGLVETHTLVVLSEFGVVSLTQN